MVEAAQAPPVCSDLREDWIRAPASQEDVSTRIASLIARAQADSIPRIDQDGILRLSGRFVTVSPTETTLVEMLVKNYRKVVAREALRAELAEQDSQASRNALDLHIKRLRRRISPLGLTIRTAWGRGYILDSDPLPVPEA